MPGYLPLLNDFKGNYEKDEDNYTSLIYKKVAPFILRRTKKEVLKDLPEKVEMVMTCEMEEQQNALYQAEKLHARDILNSGGQTFDVLFLLTRLRQLCVDPSLYIATYTEQSAKMALLKSLIKEYLSSGHRLIIFSQFVKALNIVEKYLNAQSIDYYMITGETPAEKRIEYCDKFNQFDEVPICLVSLKAGGTGLNLVGADIVIHLDPWWNNSVMDQATDRAYRIGQTKNVEVIKLICENSIEQKVIELQEKKKNLIDKIISNDDSSITSLSQEDLKFILE
jgi:SNF2 family DNA or RNA helicase